MHKESPNKPWVTIIVLTITGSVEWVIHLNQVFIYLFI